jgi:hypothetical protein
MGLGPMGIGTLGLVGTYQGRWDHGVLGPWGFGTIEFWDLGLWDLLGLTRDFGTLGLREHGALGQ